MPLTNLADYSADPSNLPSVQKAVLAADAAVGVAGTYVTAASLSLGPGLYLVTGKAHFLNGAGAAFVNSRFLVGATGSDTTEDSCIAAGSVSVRNSTIINLTATTTVAFQVTSTTATGSIKAADVNGGAVAGASAIFAVRLK